MDDEKLMQKTLDTLRELAQNPAFEDDAPEFNEGGVGHEACRKLSERLTQLTGTDYTLEDDSSMWITAGLASVYVVNGPTGVGVTIYPKGAEDDDSVTETWATWAELAYEDN
jgi:hypothetical protein